MRRPLRRGGLSLTRVAAWLVGALAFTHGAAAGAGVPAPGGEPLLAAAETAIGDEETAGAARAPAPAPRPG